MHSFVTLTFEPKGSQPCSVLLELFDQACPLAVKNFLHVAGGPQSDSSNTTAIAGSGSVAPSPAAPLKHSKVIAIDTSPSSLAQTLLFGTSASTSCFGGFFADEISLTPPPLPSLAGALLMSNVGPNTNASRFMIVLSCRSAEFANEYTCFGVVREGLEGLCDMCSRCRVDRRTLAPLQSIFITDCVVAAGGVRRQRKTGAKQSAEFGQRRIRGRDDEDNGGALLNSELGEDGRAAKKRRAEVVSATDEHVITSAAITTAALPTPEGKSFDMFEAQQHVFQHDLRDITETQTQRKRNRDSRRAKLRAYSKPSKPAKPSRGLAHRKK